MLKQAILNALGDVFTHACVVAAVRPLSEHFRLIDIEAPKLEEAQLTHADKLQLNVGEWNIRTYTPIARDGARLRLLAFVHGDSPGARWARNVEVGSTTNAVGPKAVLRIKSHDAGPLTLFGDETSFGTLLRMRVSLPAVRGVFEVSSRDESLAVLRELGVDDAVLVKKRDADAHHDELRERVDGRVVLTGSARSIQMLSRALKAKGTSPVSAKAYWAHGKTGLD